MAKENLSQKLESFKSAVLEKNWNPRYSMQHITFCLKVKKENENPQIVWEKRADPLDLVKAIPTDIIESINQSLKSIEAYSDWKLTAVLFEPGYCQSVIIDGDSDEPYVY